MKSNPGVTEYRRLGAFEVFFFLEGRETRVALTIRLTRENT